MNRKFIFGAVMIIGGILILAWVYNMGYNSGIAKGVRATTN